MKHHVLTSLLFVSCLLRADFDDSTIFDKSMRIGRFSYEDSFDESLVQTVLNNSSGAIKKNITKLLYPAKDDYEPKRLLLLGGTSNASTTAIAKSIALRCGYEYYVIEAGSLLQEYRSGSQMLLSEIRPILEQGKPIVFIITELPELVNYSGILASTLWMLLDQCEVYSEDVCVIATSMFNKGQLSQQVKERFGENIVAVSVDKYLQDKIEKEAMTIKKTSWMPSAKTVFFGSLLTACTLAQVVSAVMQVHSAILTEKFLISHGTTVESLKKQESQWTMIDSSLKTMLRKKWITTSDYIPFL